MRGGRGREYETSEEGVEKVGVQKKLEYWRWEGGSDTRILVIWTLSYKMNCYENDN